MLKIKSFIKKNKKKVIIATTILVVAIAGTSYYFYNNNQAYNNYLDEFALYGYSNENLFWEDNTIVKASTLDYMQYVLDNRINDLKSSNEYLDQFITDNDLEVIDVSKLNYYQENQSKEEIVTNYINQVSTDNELEIDSTLSISEQIDYLNSKITEKLETKYNNLKSITSKELTDDEEKEESNLKQQKKEINNAINSDISIKSKLELIEDIKDLNSDIKDFNSDVADRIEKEEEQEKEQASQTNTTSNYSSNDYYNDSSSSSNSWTGSSSSSNSSNSTSGSSATSNTSSTSQPLCEFSSNAELIAYGESTGRSYMGVPCGDGTFRIKVYDLVDNGEGEYEDVLDW